MNISRAPKNGGLMNKRENDGSLLSVDGCDAVEKGYSLHRRTRNVPAHRDGLAYPQTHEESLTGKFEHGNASKYIGLSDYSGSKATHLTREHFMKNQSKKRDDDYSSGKEELPWNLRVKPNEKIELLTGIDESPTLQASAAAWAPSHSTIAAMMSSLPRSKSPEGYHSSDSEYSEQSESDEISESEVPALTLVDLDGSYEKEEVTEDDSPSMKGLGFDPTENMDSVMMSPSIGRRDLDSSVDVDGLKLSDSVSNPMSTFNDMGNSTRFLSSTWSSSGSMGNLNNWDYLNNLAKTSTDDVAPASINSSSFLTLSLTKGEQVHASSSSHSLFNSW
jgi:hypothetical protein